MSGVSVTIYSDFTSAFCYITEAALRREQTARGLSLAYRAYELYPAPEPLPAAEDPREPAVVSLAEEVSVSLRAPGLRPRTRKAHEAARFAHERGAEDDLRSALYAAYWEDGRDIGRIDVLVELGTAVGLDPDELKIALDIDRFAPEVEREVAHARRAGVTGVPVVVIGAGPDAQVLVGARPYRDLSAAIEAGSHDARG